MCRMEFHILFLNHQSIDWPFSRPIDEQDSYRYIHKDIDIDEHCFQSNIAHHWNNFLEDNVEHYNHILQGNLT